MSETLVAILKHWTAVVPEPSEDIFSCGRIDLPFDVERFCRENDEKLAALHADRDRLRAENAELREKGCYPMPKAHGESTR